MDETESIQSYATYVVRVSRDQSGALHGVVVQIASGQRVGFRSLDGATRLLREMVAADLPQTGAPPGDPT